MSLRHETIRTSLLSYFTIWVFSQFKKRIINGKSIDYIIRGEMVIGKYNKKKKVSGLTIIYSFRTEGVKAIVKEKVIEH